jgi:hypothetical protein
VGLERGPLILVSTIAELLERKSSGSGIEIREYSRRDVTLTVWHPLSENVGTNLFTRRREGGRSHNCTLLVCLYKVSKVSRKAKDFPALLVF